MRNVDGDQGNVRLAEFGGDDGCDRLVGLKFDHQVDFFADQQFSVALRGGGVVTVVDRNDLDPFRHGRVAKALGNVSRELIVGALGRVTKAVTLLLDGAHAGLILVVADLFHHAALFQRVEKTEYHPFIEAGARSDIAQSKRFAGGLEHTQNLRRVHQTLHKIGVASTDRRAHNH